MLAELGDRRLLLAPAPLLRLREERLGEFRCFLTHANGQPAVANYLRKPGADTFVALALDVLTITGGEITEIVTFADSTFASFGLADTL